MATVFFSSELQRFTGLENHVTTKSSYREVINELLECYPRLAESGITEMAIAIDGEIVHEPLLENIPESSDIHFFPFISGG